MMWVVMTSAAQMPRSCKGRYRRVALVQLNQEYTAKDMQPKMISSRASGILRLIDMGAQSVGKTERCAYRRTLVEAQRRADQLNNTATVADNDAILASWGGSA